MPQPEQAIKLDKAWKKNIPKYVLLKLQSYKKIKAKLKRAKEAKCKHKLLYTLCNIK